MQVIFSLHPIEALEGELLEQILYSLTRGFDADIFQKISKMFGRSGLRTNLL